MNNNERTSLIPIDADWTSDMIDDIAHFIYEKKKSKHIDEASVFPMAFNIITIVNEYLSENNFKIIHNDAVV